MFQRIQALGVLDKIPFGARVLFANTQSEITLKSGATINATGDVIINSVADAMASQSMPGMWLGITYVESDATSNAIMESGTTVNAGGHFALLADIQHQMSSSVKVGTGINRKYSAIAGRLGLNPVIPGPSLAAAVGIATSNSEALVDSGATVVAGSATIEAENQNFFNVGIKAAVKGIAKQAPQLGQAAGIAVMDTESNAYSHIAGTVITTDTDHEIAIPNQAGLQFLPAKIASVSPQLLIPDVDRRRSRRVTNSPNPSPAATLPLPSAQVTFVDSPSGQLDKITRSKGFWNVDGFRPGQLINVTGTLKNNGTYQVDSISGDGRELFLRSGYQLQSETTSTAPVIVALNTILRPSGSSGADGFSVGQRIKISDTRFNNGDYRIAGMSLDGSAVTVGGSAILAPEMPRAIPADQPLLTAEVTTPITFSGSTLIRTHGKWEDEGYYVGRFITIDSPVNGFHIFRVNGLSGDGKTMTISEPVDNEVYSPLGDGRADQLAVHSRSVNTNHDIIVKAKVKPKAKPAPGSAAGSVMARVGSSPKFAKKGTIPFTVAASVLVVSGDNQATASIDSSAVVISSGDLSVTSYTEDNFKVVAISGAKGGKVAAAAGVAVSEFLVSANAEIADNAVVRAADDLKVDAFSKIPNQIDIDDQFLSLFAFGYDVPPIDTTSAATTMESTLVSTQTALMQTITLLPNFLGFFKLVRKPGAALGTTYTSASAKGDNCNPKKQENEAGIEVKKVPKACLKKDIETQFAVSGSFNILDVKQNAEAHIGTGARINVPGSEGIISLPPGFSAGTTRTFLSRPRHSAKWSTWPDKINTSCHTKAPTATSDLVGLSSRSAMITLQKLTSMTTPTYVPGTTFR